MASPITKTPTMLNVATLMTWLFAKEKEYKDSLIQEIVNDFKVTNPNAIGFKMNNTIYSVYPQKAHPRGPITLLFPSLMFNQSEKAAEFAKYIQNYESDYFRIQQVLTVQLIGLASMQQIRDAIPDSWAALVPELKNLPRHLREPWSSLNLTEAQSQQLKDTIPLMEKYAMLHLIR